MASCNSAHRKKQTVCLSQKEAVYHRKKQSITERSSLSQKETVYHDKTVHHGKKQSITERNSLSQKETVYHRKKQSNKERNCLSQNENVNMFQSGIFEFNNESRQIRCIQNKFIACICKLNLFVLLYVLVEFRFCFTRWPINV